MPQKNWFLPAVLLFFVALLLGAAWTTLADNGPGEGPWILQAVTPTTTNKVRAYLYNARTGDCYYLVNDKAQQVRGLHGSPSKKD